MEYFRLTEINETYLTNELFMLIKNSAQINTPIDWKKFISFMAIAAKGTRMERLSMIYGLIDKSPDAKLAKEDLKSHIGGTLISMIGI
jgi:Ca2+-binding EF-hand superfamily protein